MLEKTQQLDRLVWHSANTGKLLSSGSPGKVGEVKVGTCSSKTQNGTAKLGGGGVDYKYTQSRRQQEGTAVALALQGFI